ncbi:lipocalin family protein [Flagellimonas algicola]|uniref:Lipocalin family protein n=1 Tax=Flagellimonas algicola TaxID=2583815 RepID=A0ABY2WFV8_9FLAO|nr:lipocalin family protein [Allomuricauda algicola]TMU50435.1 lipocalin family protein [Allomuricauda algicola]
MRKILLCPILLPIFVISSCSNDDSIDSEIDSLENKLIGTWQWTGNYLGVSGDADGSMPPNVDLFKSTMDCIKDWFITFESPNGREQTFFFSSGNILCPGQDQREGSSPGTWNIQGDSIINIVQSDFVRPYVIIQLDEQRLLYRDLDNDSTLEGEVYEYTEYTRVD